MHIIITWEVALLAIATYFVAKYLFDTFLKLVTRCRDPFNPLYSYHDYPAWNKGYNRGRQQVVKFVKKMLAESTARLEEQAKKLERSMDSAKTESVKTEAGSSKN